jgi:hypothetical protein
VSANHRELPVRGHFHIDRELADLRLAEEGGLLRVRSVNA